MRTSCVNLKYLFGMMPCLNPGRCPGVILTKSQAALSGFPSATIFWPGPCQTIVDLCSDRGSGTNWTKKSGSKVDVQSHSRQGVRLPSISLSWGIVEDTRPASSHRQALSQVMVELAVGRHFQSERQDHLIHLIRSYRPVTQHATKICAVLVIVPPI